MSFFETMKDTLAVKSQGVAQKVSSATESVKLNNQIKTNQKMIEKILYHVGEKCFEINGDQEGTPYEEMFREIHRLQQENQSLMDQIATLTAQHICPKCGFENNGQSKFCISCGALLEQENIDFVPENGKACPVCGAMNREEAMFCVECGSKLEEN